TVLSNSAGVYGGGAFFWSILNNCILGGDTAEGGGGGTTQWTLSNCLFSGNSGRLGGGAMEGNLVNCTLARDSASSECGGVIGGTLNNCVVYSNRAPVGANYTSPSSSSTGSRDVNFSYSCTTPRPTNGVGNITNAPLFVDAAAGNFHLQFNSPC